MKRIWKEYSLSIVLAICFALSLVGQFVVGYKHFAAEQRAHGEPVHLGGDDGFIWAFGDAVLENWQSEFLQLLSFVILTTYFVHRGSHESKDADEQVQAQLDRIELKLTHLQAASPSWSARLDDSAVARRPLEAKRKGATASAGVLHGRDETFAKAHRKAST